MPVSRAIACATAVALALGGQPACRPAEARRRSAGHPRRRDRAAAARLHRADPARRRPRPAERAGRADQRARLQRLRDGRPAHLRQRRRAATIPRRRTRSSACWRTRPATSPAGISSRLREQLANAQTASIIALLLGVGAIAAGAAHRRPQHRRHRAGRHPGAAGDDPPHAALLPARAGRSGRPRRREIPQRHAAVRQGHADDLQALRRRHDDHLVARRSLSAVASDAARARRGAGRTGQDQSVLGQDRSARAAAAPRPDARQARRLPRAAGLGRAALSLERHQPAGALCARDLGLPLRRRRQRGRADRRADRRRSRTIPISTSSRARRCSKARGPRRRSRRCAARSRSRRTPR